MPFTLALYCANYLSVVDSKAVRLPFSSVIMFYSTSQRLTVILFAFGARIHLLADRTATPVRWPLGCAAAVCGLVAQVDVKRLER